MFDSMFLNFLIFAFLMITAVNGYLLFKSFMRWYRFTSYAALKTHITRHELQKIIDNRRGNSG